jgi:peptidoglycan hydrolase-like protein with peptidoglycan-binding domain
LGSIQSALTDGVFGPQTRAAIRRFQQAIGAEQTSVITAGEARRLVSTRRQPQAGD